MNQREQDEIEFAQKIRRGLALSEDRLIRAKAKNDEELILWRDGKIAHIKARDLLRERTSGTCKQSREELH